MKITIDTELMTLEVNGIKQNIESLNLKSDCEYLDISGVEGKKYYPLSVNNDLNLSWNAPYEK